MKHLNNTVIKVLTREHGKKVIEWWEKQGVDTRGINGCCNEKDEDLSIYYGLINNNFNNYGLSEINTDKAKIIELPTEDETLSEIPMLGKGVLMEVSQNKDFSYSSNRFVTAKTEKGVIAWDNAEIESKITYIHTIFWDYARPIQSPSIPEYTMEELQSKLGHEFKIKE